MDDLITIPILSLHLLKELLIVDMTFSLIFYTSSDINTLYEKCTEIFTFLMPRIIIVDYDQYNTLKLLYISESIISINPKNINLQTYYDSILMNKSIISIGLFNRIFYNYVLGKID